MTLAGLDKKIRGSGKIVWRGSEPEKEEFWQIIKPWGFGAELAPIVIGTSVQQLFILNYFIAC